jgi:hypothetical protein
MLNSISVMKIAFIGSHGVGKTGLAWTLAGYLKKEGHSVELLPEAVRIIADRGEKINESGTEKAQNLILKKQMQFEENYSVKYDIIVCDRAVIDNFIYLLRILKHKKMKKSEFGKKIKLYEKLIKDHLKKSPYDYIFYVPVVSKNFNKNDAYRSKSIEFRNEIDSMLSEYLNSSKILLTNPKTMFIALPKKNTHSWNKLVRDTIKV